MSKDNFLQHSEQQLLGDFCYLLKCMFNVEPYFVGSALTTKDFRDVDVRAMLPDKEYAKLRKLLNIDYLNLCVSLWGQKITGLPIDFQVQDTSLTNKQYPGHRHALGLWAHPELPPPAQRENE